MGRSAAEGGRRGAAAHRFEHAHAAGYNRWADGNRLIVLYPQARASWSFLAFNPRGCWDWWGYTGEDYRYLRTFPAMVRLKFLSDAEIDTYLLGGAGAARMTVASTLPQGKVIVAVVKMPDRDAALRTADRLDEVQLAAGFQRRLGEPVARTVDAVPADAASSARPTVRAHYVHEDLVVRVELAGRTVPDIRAGFPPLLAAQLDVLPADG